MPYTRFDYNSLGTQDGQCVEQGTKECPAQNEEVSPRDMDGPRPGKMPIGPLIYS